MTTLQAVYGVLTLVGLVVGLVSMTAARTGAGRHVGAQAAALRGPLGIAITAWSSLGLLAGAWLVATAGLVVGVALLRSSLPLRRPFARSARLRPDSRDATGSGDIRLITANVLVDSRRFAELARQLLADSPDVLVLQEVTRAHADALLELTRHRHDLHVVMEPREDYAGWATVSRFPVLGEGRVDVPGWPVSWVVVGHPASPIRVVNVHAAAPQTSEDVDAWRRQFDTMADLADRSLPTVLAGDFNATGDHLPFRRLLDAGFTDAFDAAGSGWGATWPVGSPVPPLLRLDHVLVDGSFVVDSIRPVDLPGSDHRGLSVLLTPADRVDASGPGASVPGRGDRDAVLSTGPDQPGDPGGGGGVCTPIVGYPPPTAAGPR